MRDMLAREQRDCDEAMREHRENVNRGISDADRMYKDSTNDYKEAQNEAEG